MNLRFLKSSEKKDILEKLETHFGITKMPYLLLETGKEKIRGFSGSLSKEEIQDLGEIAHVEIIGLYMLKKEQDVRISFDALHLLKEHISKGIIELNEEEYHSWIRGNDIQKDSKPGIYIISYQGDFLGCGKSNGQTLFNYIPKERRLKR